MPSAVPAFALAVGVLGLAACGHRGADVAPESTARAVPALEPAHVPGHDPTHDPTHDCHFDAGTLSFAGSSRDEARCLLRPLERYGRSGPPLERLPDFLATRVGEPIDSELAARTRARLALRLEHLGIDQADIGGSLERPLSTTEPEFGPSRPARYFVLHDTSHPNLLDARSFPERMNETDWEHNRVERWQEGESSKAHVFVGRDGRSATAIPFSRGWRATKLESRVVGPASRGRLLHVEHVQPRRSDPEGPVGNDAIAPVPGFTPEQLDRSALLYVTACLRAELWLVPAYHHNVDAPIPGAHDDPQNWDLDDWTSRVAALWHAVSAP